MHDACYTSGMHGCSRAYQAMDAAKFEQLAMLFEFMRTKRFRIRSMEFAREER